MKSEGHLPGSYIPEVPSCGRRRESRAVPATKLYTECAQNICYTATVVTIKITWSSVWVRCACSPCITSDCFVDVH